MPLNKETKPNQTYNKTSIQSRGHRAALLEATFLPVLWFHIDSNSSFEAKNSFAETSTSSQLLKRRRCRKSAMDQN